MLRAKKTGFLARSIKKLGVAWGRGYTYSTCKCSLRLQLVLKPIPLHVYWKTCLVGSLSPNRLNLTFPYRMHLIGFSFSTVI